VPAESSASLYKSILKSSGLYVVAIVIQRLASVILIPVYTRYLDPAAYGTLELVDLTVGLLGLFMGATFSYALYYFAARAKDETERQQAISTAIFGAILLGLVGAAIGVSLAGPLSRLVFQSDQYSYYFRLSFGSFAVSLPLEMCYACLRAQDRPLAFVISSLSRLVVTGSATLTYLVVLHWGIAAVILGNMTGTGVLAVALAVLCLRQIPAENRRLRPAIFWAQARYAAPSIFVGLSTNVLHSGDRYFLQRHVPLADVGLYSFAYRGGMLISYCQQAFGNYWSAQIYTVVDRRDGDYIFSRLFTYFMAVMTAMGLLLSLFARPAITLLTAPIYHSAYIYVPWVVAIYVTRASGDFFRPVVYAKGKPHLDARLNITAAIVCIASYALLIPPFKAWGAIAATAFGFITNAIYAWYLARKLQMFTLEYGRLLRVFGLALIDVAAVQHFESTAVSGQLLLATAGAVAYPLALIASGFLTAGERETLRGRLAALTTQRRVMPAADKR
jgi:O-antigen/teichoic acid export membrane protein